MTKPALMVLKSVTKSFKNGQESLQVLKGIDLSVDEGDFVAIMGPSGSGKSTLMNIIGLLDQPTTGSYQLEGEDVADLSENRLAKVRNDQIGFIFQQFFLLPKLSAQKNVELPLIYAGKSPRERKQRAQQFLEKVGLSDRSHHLPSELSGGQKQRVAIARALASDPKILLCDEATSALDPQTTSSILALLKDINQRFNITIVIITHQMSVVREICSHVAIVKGGEVAEQGTVEDIFTHPQTAVARELLKNDVGDDGEEKRGTTAGGKEIIKSGEKIRIVFSENSAFEPVIANLILNFNEPVNILKADTKNVGGVAKGEMVLEFAPDCTKNKEMKQYLLDRGLEIEEVSEHVD